MGAGTRVILHRSLRDHSTWAWGRVGGRGLEGGGGVDEETGPLGTSIPGPEGSSAVLHPVYPSIAKYSMQRLPVAEAF